MLTSKYYENEKKLLIKFPEKFNYKFENQFNSILKDDKKVVLYELDFEETKQIDSSALGFLLSLKSHSESVHSEVVILNISEDVKKIFKVTNYDKVFNLDN